MKITKTFLKRENACSEGYAWFLSCGETDHELVIAKLIAEEHEDWANWCIVRLMTHKQRIMYAIYAAEQVIDIFEKAYPNDDRPRKAIEAARKYSKYSTKENQSAARSAAYAADAAADAADAADAAYAAYAAARSAYSAAYLDRSAADAAANAARSAADAVALKTIIEYGLSIL